MTTNKQAMPDNLKAILTTDKPEVVAHMSPAFGEVVSQQDYAGWEHNASRNPDTEYGNRYRDKTLVYSEPLICLSDYEALQAECEELGEELVETELRALKFIHQCNAHIELYRELRGECDLLRAAIRRLCNIYVVDDYYSGEQREELLDAAVRRAIERASHDQ